MAKGHRSQIKRARNANKDTRPSAKLSYTRMSVQKACYVLDVIRGNDVQTALGILTYNPRSVSYTHLVSDKGYRGVVIQLWKNFSDIETEDNTIKMCIRDRRKYSALFAIGILRLHLKGI